MGFWPAPALTGVLAPDATAGPAAPPVDTAAVPVDAPVAGVTGAAPAGGGGGRRGGYGSGSCQGVS